MKINLNDKWTIKKAKELYTYTSGISKGSQFFGTGYPYLTFTEIFHNYFVPDELTSLVQSNDRERENCSIKRGDVFLTRTSETDNELGMSCVALKDYPNATFNGFTKRLRPLTDEVVPEYAGFYFRSPIFRAAVTSMSSIITRASLNEKMLDKLPICYPSKPTQQKIASILSAYDNLIQNYKKQIEALQTAASELYKEWFVRFRFPGWKNAKFENGIPEGWKVEKLFDVAKIIYGYPFNSDEFCDDSTLNPVVRIRDILDNHTDTYTSESCDEKYWINPNEMLIGMDGIFHMTLWTGERALQNQRTVRVISKVRNLSNYYLYFSLYPQIKALEQMIVGTTVAHLGDKHLKKITILIPAEKILKMSYEKFEPMMNRIYSLQQQITNLTQQRDLLLPRLMSGKLEVK